MGLHSGSRLPDWPDEGTDSSLRDIEEEYVSTPALSQVRAIMGGLGTGKIASPIVLTPTGGASPMGSLPGQGLASKGPWMDLDKFLEDAGSEEEEESEEDEAESTEEESDSASSSRPRNLDGANAHVGDSHHQGTDSEGDEESNESDGGEG